MKFEPEREVRIEYRQTNLDFKIFASIAVAFGLLYGCSYIGEKMKLNKKQDTNTMTFSNRLERITK